MYPQRCPGNVDAFALSTSTDRSKVTNTCSGSEIERGLAVELAELLEVEPGSLSRVELKEWVLGAQALEDRVRAARLLLEGEWDAGGVWADDGSLSGAAWLAVHAQVERTAAGRDLRLAARLRRYPALAEAGASGRLSAAKVAAIAAAATDRHGSVFVEHVEQLIAEAERLSFEDTSRWSGCGKRWPKPWCHPTRPATGTSLCRGRTCRGP
jgi:hypothetical protein